MAECFSGEFSAKTKRILTEKFRAGEVTFTEKYLCVKCGGSAFAESKGGEWVPRTHERPTRRAYKDIGRKRRSRYLPPNDSGHFDSRNRKKRCQKDSPDDLPPCSMVFGNVVPINILFLAADNSRFAKVPNGVGRNGPGHHYRNLLL